MEKRRRFVKKLLLFVAVGLLVIVSFVVYRTFQPNPLEDGPKKLPSAVTDTPTPRQYLTVRYGGGTYGYDMVTVSDPDTLDLIPNFTARLDTTTLMEQYGCQKGVNGGFYDTENQPLGLFIADGNTLRQAVQNRLINGFVSVLGRQALISSNPPGATVRLSLQTGPLLLSDGSPLALAIRNDEPARRVVAAINGNGTLYFIVIFDEEGVFLGPKLADLPAIVATISEDNHLRLDSAVNLDGGSASAFFSETTRLSELTAVGSLFCIK